MSYSKADQLLQLATLVSSRHLGVTLDDTSDKFSVSHRTAQRMMRALEIQFPDVTSFDGNDGRRRWRLTNNHLLDLIALSAEELASIDIGIRYLEHGGLGPEAQYLRQLKDKVLALIPRSKARLEPDYDALLEAQGFIARPGPRPRINEHVHTKLVEAIKSCHYIDIQFTNPDTQEDQHKHIAPYGFLTGARRYLVANDPNDERGPTIKTYRIDHISDVNIVDGYFERPAAFSLQSFANSAFGIFRRNEDVADVIWRFQPQVAQRALQYQFHPNQTEEIQSDGSLIVKFKSAGLIDMAWYLYAWGDKVEVISPDALKDMIRGHQRTDFFAMP